MREKKINNSSWDKHSIVPWFGSSGRDPWLGLDGTPSQGLSPFGVKEMWQFQPVSKPIFSAKTCKYKTHINHNFMQLKVFNVHVGFFAPFYPQALIWFQINSTCYKYDSGRLGESEIKVAICGCLDSSVHTALAAIFSKHSNIFFVFSFSF